MSGRLVGSLVSLSFGVVFLLVNSAHLPGAGALVVRILAVLGILTFVLSAVGNRHRLVIARAQESSDPFRGRFPMILAGEVVLLFGGLAVLGRVFDLQEAGVAWVATVVGAHFLPMGRVTGMRVFLVLAVVITPLGLAGLALAVAGRPIWSVELVAGVGPGVVLLCAAVWAVTGGLAAQLRDTEELRATDGVRT